MTSVADERTSDESTRESLVRLLSAITFLIFFQAYMVAPLLPRLAIEFGTSPEGAGSIVPAYLLPYGISTLLYGVLSDRIGRRRLVIGSLSAFILLTALTATARSIEALFMWRLLTGIGASAVVPLSLSLMGTFFPYGIGNGLPVLVVGTAAGEATKRLQRLGWAQWINRGAGVAMLALGGYLVFATARGGG